MSVSPSVSESASPSASPSGPEIYTAIGGTPMHVKPWDERDDEEALIMIILSELSDE